MMQQKYNYEDHFQNFQMHLNGANQTCRILFKVASSNINVCRLILHISNASGHSLLENKRK